MVRLRLGSLTGGLPLAQQLFVILQDFDFPLPLLFHRALQLLFGPLKSGLCRLAALFRFSLAGVEIFFCPAKLLHGFFQQHFLAADQFLMARRIQLSLVGVLQRLLGGGALLVPESLLLLRARLHQFFFRALQGLFPELHLPLEILFGPLLPGAALFAGLLQSRFLFDQSLSRYRQFLAGEIEFPLLLIAGCLPLLLGPLPGLLGFLFACCCWSRTCWRSCAAR